MRIKKLFHREVSALRPVPNKFRIMELMKFAGTL